MPVKPSAIGWTFSHDQFFWPECANFPTIVQQTSDNSFASRSGIPEFNHLYGSKVVFEDIPA